MVLTIDVGNSNIVLGVFENENIKFIARMSTQSTRLQQIFMPFLTFIIQILMKYTVPLYPLLCHSLRLHWQKLLKQLQV